MIGVLGGTGNTGSQVVKALKAKGTAFKAIVRDPKAAAEKLGADVELAQGDLSDPASLEPAFAGLDTLYILCGHSPNLAQMEINALEAAKKAGVGNVVVSTGSEKGVSPDGPSEILRMHYQVEQAVKESGVKWTISRPNFFMSNLLNMAQPVVQANKLITALPIETAVTMVHPADVGESGAELLTGDGHRGNAYFLTGPSVTMGEVAQTLSSALGREITYVQVPPEAARKAMEERGMPDWLMAHMGGMMGFVAKGQMAGSTDNVAKLTGHPPRTFAEWVGENKAAFGG